MRVGEYLTAPRPAWDWIALDCCRWVDRWVVLNGHASPIEALGLRYDSERSALRTIRQGGGLLALWTPGMLKVAVPDLHADEMLLPGDVGVIARETVCGLGEAMGIWTGERWATLGLRGIDVAPAVVLRAWRV